MFHHKHVCLIISYTFNGTITVELCHCTVDGFQMMKISVNIFSIRSEIKFMFYINLFRNVQN